MEKQKAKKYQWWNLPIGTILAGLLSSLVQSPLLKMLLAVVAIIVLASLVIDRLKKSSSWQRRQVTAFRSLQATINASQHPLYRLSTRKAKFLYGLVPVSFLVVFFSAVVLQIVTGGESLKYSVYIAAGFFVMVLIWIFHGFYVLWLSGYRKFAYGGVAFYIIAIANSVVAHLFDDGTFFKNFLLTYMLLAGLGIFVVLGWVGFLTYKYLFPLVQYRKLRSMIDAGIINVQDVNHKFNE